MKRSILSATLIAGMTLGATGLQAQQNKANYDNDRDRTRVRANAELNKEGLGAAKVGKFHKASKLIGMNVKNQQDEGLGEIEELVVDLDSGRISYVVLGVGGILGIGEKYIAIPPSAFNRSADDDKLVLNADKSKIEQAPGFTKDNWPDVENPAWGAYWGARATTLPGERDQFENRQQRQQFDRQQQLDQQRDRGQLERRELRTTRPGQQQQQAGRDMFSGEIISMNPQARTMTVKGDLGTQVFVIDQTATVRLKEVPSGKLSDLKVGDRVNVNFHKQGDGTGIAYTIQSSDQEKEQK